MISGPNPSRSGRWRGPAMRLAGWFVLALWAFPTTGSALPARLVLALDGIAYRDLQALQNGILRTNFWGRPTRLQAFSATEGYFPVSRMISTFPSTSDVAWTDILGNRPLPGYQRTYFSVAANSEVVQSGVSTTVEHEKQMDWQAENSLVRAMGYLYPVHTFQFELHELAKHFFTARPDETNFYIYFRSSDDAQHMDRDIFDLLERLDRQLQAMRTRYREQTGRDLQILILSDHGHNHAGPGKRVGVRSFLESAGYRITSTIASPKDVVLPTGGIETWVEIHNAPESTGRLAEFLAHLPGVDILAAAIPNQPERFLVVNHRSERALIDWDPANNRYRYSPAAGDPLHYRPVVATLNALHQLDADGFAPADAWLAATTTNPYPMALERIARAFTRSTLNPATILISLDNHYVHASWLVKKSSRLATYGSTHGSLDDINSDGIVLNNFMPTPDTASDRVAGLFGGFPGLKNYRAEESSAEWVTAAEQSLTRIPRTPFDRHFKELPAADVFLRMWSPRLVRLEPTALIQIRIEKRPPFSTAEIRRGEPKPAADTGLHLTLNQPLPLPEQKPGERVYALPPEVVLAPQSDYQISGWLPNPTRHDRLFDFTFRTDRNGRPAAY